jgi:hypothetical protein
MGGMDARPAPERTCAELETVSTGDLLERLSLALWDLREELASAEREAARMGVLRTSGALEADLLVFATALDRQNDRLRDELAALWVDYASLRAIG